MFYQQNGAQMRLQGGFRSELKLTLPEQPLRLTFIAVIVAARASSRITAIFFRRLTGGGDMGGLVGMPQLPVNDEHASQKYHQRQEKAIHAFRRFISFIYWACNGV